MMQDVARADGRRGYVLPKVFALVLLFHVLLLLALLDVDSVSRNIVVTPVMTGVLLKPDRPKQHVTQKLEQPKQKTRRPVVKKKTEPVRPKVMKPLPVPAKTRPVEPPQQQVRPVSKSAVATEPLVEPRVDAERLDNPAPVYPRVSLRRKEQGRVILEVLILTDGTVGDIRIKQSSGYKRLDKAALEAVRRWRYLPARRGKQLLEYWYQQSIVFSLRK